jgi:homoserine dehydrogenase
MIQRGRSDGDDSAVPVVLVTHETNERAMRDSLDRIALVHTVLERPAMIRIEPG